MHIKFKNLVEMVAKLRAPDGCPWDKQQTIKSMKEHLMEEAEELAEAIDNENAEEIEEELGDVILVLLMIAQIAQEEKKFDIGSSLDRVAEKLISRHTWVFGTDEAKTPEEALELWLKNKAKEKAKKENKKKS